MRVKIEVSKDKSLDMFYTEVENLTYTKLVNAILEGLKVIANKDVDFRIGEVMRSVNSSSLVIARELDKNKTKVSIGGGVLVRGILSVKNNERYFSGFPFFNFTISVERICE